MPRFNEVTILAKSLDGLRRAVSKLARQINAADSLLPTFGRSIDFAVPNIEVDQHGFHFVVVERGQERERKSTSDPNELAYWIFEHMTFGMALDYELHHRNEGKDFRRMLFAKQQELLGQLDSSWRQRQEADHLRILEKYPFDDQSSLRAQYDKQLRDSGMPAGRAHSLACEKYPLPKEKQNHRLDGTGTPSRTSPSPQP